MIKVYKEGLHVRTDGTIDMVSDGLSASPELNIKLGDEERTIRGNGITLSDVHDNGIVTKAKGSTVKWNQLVENGDFSNGTTGWSGSYLTVELDGSVSSKANSGGNTECYIGVKKIINHKYYYRQTIKAEIEVMVFSNMFENTIISTDWTTLKIIKTATSSRDDFPFNTYTFNKSAFANKKLYYKDNMAFDLTAIFGAGNEPATVADFETWLETNVGLKDYYDYDAGSLIPVKTSKITTTDGSKVTEAKMNVTTLQGKLNGNGNLVTIFPDGLKQAGSVKDEIDWANGVAVKRVGVVDLGSLDWIKFQDDRFRTEIRISSMRISVARRTKLVVSKLYTEQINGEEFDVTKDMIIYGSDGFIIIHNFSYSDTTTFKAAMQGVMLYYELDTPETYYFDTHVDIKRRYIGVDILNGASSIQGSVSINGGRLIPNNNYSWVKDKDGHIIFPDGMKKAGSVYDEITMVNGVLKAIKRVGVVDLGDINWQYRTSYSFFDIPVEFRPSPQDIKDSAQCSCALYNFVYNSPDSLFTNAQNMSLTSTTTLKIKDTSYSDAATFKQAMQGVLLYYELATPIEYVIDNIREVVKVVDGNDVVYRNQDYYGVRWAYSNGENSTTLERIGRAEWHNSLPIQSKMRRCILGSDGSVRYVHPDNYLIDTEGNAIDYTVTEANGVKYDVMVEVPEHYYETGSETVDGVTYRYIRLYPYAKVGRKVPKHYIGAFKASLNRTTDELFSCCKTVFGNDYYDVDGSTLSYAEDAVTFRGGSNDTTYDGTGKTLYGRPASNKSITDFCTYAKNRGSGYALKHWESHWCMWRLFVVEYATFNSQNVFNAMLDADGNHQGGLGFGLCSTTDAWSTYNNYNPIAPCGITLRLGSSTGIVKYVPAVQYGSDSYFNVPSYRGIENPFGDIWEMVNGIYIYGADSKNYIMTADDGWHVRDFSYNSSTTPITGFTNRTGDINLGLVQGWPTDFIWDEYGDVIPSVVNTSAGSTADSTSPLRDYFWGNNTSAKKVLVGSSLNNGVRAGLACIYVNLGVDIVVRGSGSRLLYIAE